jgi:hypothetical protein
MLLEQFGGANGELAAAMQYSVQGLNCDDPARKDLLLALNTLVTDPLAVGNIPPSEEFVNVYFNDSTGEGPDGGDETGPWNSGNGWQVVEAPAFQALKAAG